MKSFVSFFIQGGPNHFITTFVCSLNRNFENNPIITIILLKLLLKVKIFPENSIFLLNNIHKPVYMWVGISSI
jgi:hypothetical protein